MLAMTCSICLHPQLNEIEDALSTGLSVRAAQARFGLSKSAIARHRSRCLALKIAAAARIVTPSPAKAQVQRAKAIVAGEVATPGDVITLTGLLDRLTRSLDRLEGAADSAAVEGDVTPISRPSITRILSKFERSLMCMARGVRAEPLGCKARSVTNE